jgi:hypothetical protein
VKHYESRLRWAEVALAAFEEDDVAPPRRPPDRSKDKPTQEQPASRGLFHALVAFAAAFFRKGK